jgi:peptidoglycan hydrolase-like protein with peptidoglycan-binding domain
MALQSKLFRGDPKLEAAAVLDTAHITIGAWGEHVHKIQFALTVLDGVNIAQDGAYGAETAAAVLAYKQKRSIINRSYQTQADNIVGKMTMASLDTEMLKREMVPDAPVRIIPLSHWVVRPPKSPAILALPSGSRSLGFNVATGSEGTLGMDALFAGELTIQPSGTGSFVVIDGSPGSIEIEDPTIAKLKPAGGSFGDRFVVTENRQTFRIFSGQRSGITRITARRVPSILKPPPAPKPGSAASVTLQAGLPIVFLGVGWLNAERAKILAALQQLTNDALVLSPPGDRIFVDGSRSVASNRNTGQTLLRGLQHPTQKVIIVPQTGSLIPDTTRSKTRGNEILVELAFTGADLATFAFFTITGANVPGPGGNGVEKSPGFVPLAHELVHAFRMLRNLFVGGSRNHEFFDPSGNRFVQNVFLEELTVIGIDGKEAITENRIRAEQGLGSRAAYASPAFALDIQGVRPVSAAPPWWPQYPVPP